MNKYVLFLCGGKWQLPWLTYLKSRGHRILLVDPYDTAPCVALADVYFKCDVKNISAILDYVALHNYNIELVTSEQTDVSTLPVAIISQKLQLKANDPVVVERFTNKYISRKFVKENFGLYYPDFCAAHHPDDIQKILDKYGKIIVKPVDAQSSRGVSVLNSYEDDYVVSQAFNHAQTFSSQMYVLAEEFVVGREITLEGFCFENRHVTLTGSDKMHFRTGIASDLSYPLKLNSDIFSKLITFHNTLVEKTGLDFGITHSEYIISEDKKNFWLVEMACRGGGSLIPSHIVPWASGFDCYDFLYNVLFTRSNDIIPKQIDFSSQRKALLHFFEFKAGRVKSIEGLEACKILEGVLDIDIDFREGDSILPAVDDRSRQGYCIILANDESEERRTLSKINNLLHIRYNLNFNEAIKKLTPSASMMKGLSTKDYSYNLAIGAPDIQPPGAVKDIILAYAQNPVFRYLPSKGTAKALFNLKQLLFKDADLVDPIKNCILVPGAKYGIFISLKTVCNPKDKVLLFEPYWLSYPEICKSLDLKIETITIDPFSGRYNTQNIISIVTEHDISAVVLNNPVNPSGFVFTNAEIMEIVEFCAKRNTWVILDEVYKDLCFDRNLKLHHNLMAANLVRVGSLSKSLNLPGYRAGYVLGDEIFINLFDLLHQHISTCIHPLTDEIISNIPADTFESYTGQCALIYAERFNLAKSILSEKGFDVVESQAAFYLMADVSNKFSSGNEASEYYDRNGISVTPGENYGKNYRNFIRICLTLPKEELAIVLNQL